VSEKSAYPVIDLFAGPGGLGEGFAALPQCENSDSHAFKIAISIEKDPHAHTTLQLRHFFRQFQPEMLPDDYYHYLKGTISRDDLYLRHPEESRIAQQTAWLCTLGEEPHDNCKDEIFKGGCRPSQVGVGWGASLSGIFSSWAFAHDGRSEL
jgi:DNA (cytosine-5)-methyltransferase 1